MCGIFILKDLTNKERKVKMGYDWNLFSKRLGITARRLSIRALNTLAGPYSTWELVYSPKKNNTAYYRNILCLIKYVLENEFGVSPSIRAIEHQINYIISNQTSIDKFRVKYFKELAGIALDEGFIDKDFYTRRLEFYLTNKN